MPFNEQDKAVLSDIVEAFTFAIVEVCQTLEHQKQMAPAAFVEEITLRADSLPADSSGKIKRNILTNICRVLEGKPYPSGSFFDMQDSARKVA